MSMSEFFAWWRKVAKDNTSDTIDLGHVRLMIGCLRRQSYWQLEDATKKLLHHNFCYYGLTVTQTLSAPLPLSKRTFEGSNFVKVYAALQQRVMQLGKMPTLYVLNAVRVLVKTFLTQNKMQHQWAKHFNEVLASVIKNKTFESDVEATAEYLWTSAVPLVKGKSHLQPCQKKTDTI